MPKESLCAVRRMAAVILAGVFAAGCGGQPSRSLDKSLAREALGTALTSWKAGASIKELKDRSPAIIVGDPDWKSGARLVDYRIVDAETDDGFNLHCTVQLKIRGRDGKEQAKRIVYIIGTSPAVTIFPE